MKIDISYFQSVESSMTSDDSRTFMLHVKRPTGSDLVLGFRPASSFKLIT
jgi:hypothetical protein